MRRRRQLPPIRARIKIASIDPEWLALLVDRANIRGKPRRSKSHYFLCAIRLTTDKIARTVASTVSVDVPRPRIVSLLCRTSTVTSPSASWPKVALLTW